MSGFIANTTNAYKAQDDKNYFDIKTENLYQIINLLQMITMMKAIAPTNIVPRTPPTIASILVGSFICKTKSNKKKNS